MPRCHRGQASDAPGCLGAPHGRCRGSRRDGSKRLRNGGQDGRAAITGCDVGFARSGVARRDVSAADVSVTGVDDVGIADSSVVDHRAGRTEVPDVPSRQRLEHRHLEAAGGLTQRRVAAQYELVVDVPAS
jgi:hypothetical protein